MVLQTFFCFDDWQIQKEGRISLRNELLCTVSQAVFSSEGYKRGMSISLEPFENFGNLNNFFSILEYFFLIARKIVEGASSSKEVRIN